MIPGFTNHKCSIRPHHLLMIGNPRRFHWPMHTHSLHPAPVDLFSSILWKHPCLKKYNTMHHVSTKHESKISQ
ncbi:hypothetical protein BDV32DRAFT_60476 [Aspergillus pseudonomiae]|nr:hypothetical protein BDV32DRAFT_60476 [Aspergillus pseudonomiae]